MLKLLILPSKTSATESLCGKSLGKRLSSVYIQYVDHAAEKYAAPESVDGTGDADEFGNFQQTGILRKADTNCIFSEKDGHHQKQRQPATWQLECMRFTGIADVPGAAEKNRQRNSRHYRPSPASQRQRARAEGSPHA